MSARNRISSSILAGLLLGATAVAAPVTPASGLQTPGLPESALPEPTVPVIIEVFDPSIDLNSPEAEADIAAMLAVADQDVLPEQSRAAGLQASAVGGQISVNFITTPPADVQGVVNAAVADWNAVLSSPSGAPIVVDFRWEALQPGYLGWARPTHLENSAALPTSDWYPTALANALVGFDMRPSEAEIEIGIASNLYNTTNGWYAGTGAVPFNRRDLYSTMLHEIGHGLGFIGTAQQAGGQSPGISNPPLVFDRLARFNGSSIINAGNASSALTSNNLYINIGGEQLRRLYAPGSFLNGSSFSHFDESYQPGQPGSMMSPALGLGQTDRAIDAAILGVMEGIGWNVSAPPLAPTLTDVTAGSGQLSASWSVDLSQQGLPPVSYQLAAKQGSTTDNLIDLHWSSLSGNLGGLTNFADYDLVVTSIANDGATASTTFDAEGDPYLLKANGNALSRTLTWEPMSSAGSNGATYTLERSKDGGAFITIGTTAGTSLSDSNLSPGIFQYRVTGTTAAGTSGEARSLFVGATTTTVRPFSLDGQVARLYNAYFDRDPDSSGMAYWLGQRAAGTSLESMSQTFAASPEFAAKYGNLSNADFVNLVYTEVIGRQADAEGFNYWLGLLNSGMSRGTMMIGFSEAPEYINQTGTVAPQSSVEAGLYRLYLAYFLRSPDSSGFGYWLGQANAGASLETISAQFATSPEFVGQYGSLSNDDFVQLVYRNVLTREPEANGQSYWVGQLDASASRGDVMVGFSNSAEFLLATGTLP